MWGTTSGLRMCTLLLSLQVRSFDLAFCLSSVFHWCLPFDDILVKEFSRELYESIDTYVREYENRTVLHQTPGEFQQHTFGRKMSRDPYTFPLLMNEAMAD